jgi:predicted Zn finger-like uncharacterized protein
MPEAWKSKAGGHFTCPHCGAVYSVTYNRLPLRDQDIAKCEVCGETMDEWNSTTVPSYTLIKLPAEPKSEG